MPGQCLKVVPSFICSDGRLLYQQIDALCQRTTMPAKDSLSLPLSLPLPSSLPFTLCLSHSFSLCHSLPPHSNLHFIFSFHSSFPCSLTSTEARRKVVYVVVVVAGGRLQAMALESRDIDAFGGVVLSCVVLCFAW